MSGYIISMRLSCIIIKKNNKYTLKNISNNRKKHCRLHRNVKSRLWTATMDICVCVCVWFLSMHLHLHCTPKKSALPEHNLSMQCILFNECCVCAFTCFVRSSFSSFQFADRCCHQQLIKGVVSREAYINATCTLPRFTFETIKDKQCSTTHNDKNKWWQKTTKKVRRQDEAKVCVCVYSSRLRWRNTKTIKIVLTLILNLPGTLHIAR